MSFSFNSPLRSIKELNGGRLIDEFMSVTFNMYPKKPCGRQAYSLLLFFFFTFREILSRTTFTDPTESFITEETLKLTNSDFFF